MRVRKRRNELRKVLQLLRVGGEQHRVVLVQGRKEFTSSIAKFIRLDQEKQVRVYFFLSLKNVIPLFVFS